ncbi:MAG TPA: histidine kinase [Candidatus Saccharimonadales bacterium]|nr:histidine kinase [Candidatus Saccharimonadales bacterium]
MKRRLMSVLFIPFALLSAMAWNTAGQTNQTLTNASAVLALSGEEAAQGIKISITGVVTAAEPRWGGRFFIQDSSGGVFVENISDDQPSPGEVLAVYGVSYPGGYAPIISHPHWMKIGEAPLPPAKPVAIEQLMSGAEDSQRIEISGVVRKAEIGDNLLRVELSSGGYRLPVYAPIPPGIDPQKLIGAKVDVKGTPATAYNAPLRHLISVDLYVPSVKDFVIEKSAQADPFSEPLTLINNIAQYRAGRSVNDRVHVKGVLIYQRLGEDMFIKDASGGLQIKSSQVNPLARGDVVEAVGFPGFENFLPVLEDAVFRKASGPRVNVTPTNAPVAEILQGLHHSDLVTIRGKLLDRLEEQGTSPTGEPEVKTVLVLQASNVMFTAQAETAGPNLFLKSIPVGSVIEVSGVCFVQSDENGSIKSFQVLLPTSNSFRMIARPGWLTPEHLLITLGCAVVVIIVGTSWTIMVTRRNSALRHLIRERERDQMELQKAHDTLEWRVKERTEQLKFQITARKESEVQFKATLAERTRLAKELHDTIEQNMTGMTLQLNTVNKLLEQDPGAAAHHLGLIRNMMRMSRVDLRRSIWDLRSRELEQFDLYKALSLGANRIAGNAGIPVEVESKGAARPLPEFIEETLLRIGQEAVTNTVKHSGANSIKIDLEYRDHSIALEVKDNGRGFTPENCAGPDDGHFGLLGMSERTKRLGGQISIISAPGTGTVVRVELPIARAEMTKLNDEQPEHEERVGGTNFGG